MTRGRVYLWETDKQKLSGGSASVAVVPLPNLVLKPRPVLCGQFVQVLNGGEINVPAESGYGVERLAIGNATSDETGDFLFEQGRGGGRIDKVLLADADVRWRYVQASHFGEVNVYFHLDRIAAYVARLLCALGAAALPRVTAIVNAHHGATELDRQGTRDGVRGTRCWLPLQGAHYRLAGPGIGVAERTPPSADGEIHFGPGWRLCQHGALAEKAGGPYRANASHNPGIIYHEYGHHVVRHTADLRANAMRPDGAQDSRKCELDEATSDYFAATLLDTPHIWAFHHRHDQDQIHSRSLLSNKTMADYDDGPGSDPHTNGTIWASGLWDLRTSLAMVEPNGVAQCDLLVLGYLLLLGTLWGERLPRTVGRVRRARRGFATGLRSLLEADERQNGGRHRALILETFERRGITPALGGRADCQQASAASTA